jgi:diaminohydroxyphosphoribosylaminopyrimidine deaminase / 5-amino-6-(5-phosphoribosylamino)uracil reductase
MLKGLIEFELNGSNMIIKGSHVYPDYIQKDSCVSVNGIRLTVNEILPVPRLYITNDIMNKVVFRSPANIEYGVEDGEIDCTGQILNITLQLDETRDIWIKPEIQKAIYNDQIRLDGIKLTVEEVYSNMFRVTIPKEMWETTSFKYLLQDMFVNIEYNRYDEYWMKLALDEAEKGRFTASPNPWVGCVIVKDNKIIGKGYHLKPGSPHAEVMAIRDAENKGFTIEDSTIYVTLEPCSHHGRTPPCVDLLIKKAPSRVVIGLLDPDHKVNGRGKQKLIEAGIRVTTRILKESISESLKSYIHHRKTGLPYIIVKIGLSLDGCYALQNKTPYWFTNEESRKYAHQIRAKSQAIIIGKTTELSDNPKLTTRLPNLPDDYIQPRKIILTREMNIPDLMKKIGEEGVIQCLIEGGAVIQNEFFKLGLVNELIIQESFKTLELPGIRWFDNVSLNKCHLQPKETFVLNGDITKRYIVNYR